MLTLLMVEDEVPIRTLAKVCLERAGYRVVDAGTLGEALAAIRAGGIAAALADTTLPDACGAGVLNAFRALDSQLPVILFAGPAEHREALAPLQDGRTLVVGKPWSPCELVALVMDLLVSTGGQAPVQRPMPEPGAPVAVDLGSGSGLSAFEASDRHPTWLVVAVDASPAACGRARERAARLGYGNVLFVAGDASRLPLRAGCAAEVLLSYAPLPAEEPSVAREQSRVLAAGGGAAASGAAALCCAQRSDPVAVFGQPGRDTP